MPWNPEKYNQFKNIRYQPFFDLMKMIREEGIKKAVDLGCGTGEQTSILSAQFEQADFLGIDPSNEMLAERKKFESDRLRFRVSTVEDFIQSDKSQKWDLIFSNAALQWSDDHETVFPKLISLLSEGGQFAVQMPVQKENVLNQLLLELVSEKPFADYLQGWRRESPVLSIDHYAQIMFECGLQQIQIMQKVYPIIAENADQLFDFISGSSLIPYMERLKEDQKKEFISAYKNRISRVFAKFPAIYAFKRLLLYGIR